jgi:hypothetical protein
MHYRLPFTSKTGGLGPRNMYAFVAVRMILDLSCPLNVSLDVPPGQWVLSYPLTLLNLVSVDEALQDENTICDP